LLVAVGLVFGQTARHDFVNYDDSRYVYENPHIARGLTAQGIFWVFTHKHGGNWHPLTGLTHMFDCQVFGLHAGGHHLTNMLLHAATAVLLFLVLRQMTGGFWPSAMVAAIFAVHPLRVESVAWISERKDVLSGLCFVGTLGTYVRYVRSPFSLGRYLLLVVVFALGLMAKPMLVTLPLLLLLLDYWPLGRMTAATAGNTAVGSGRWVRRFSVPRHLVFEKVPLLLLAAVCCWLTFWAQGIAVASHEALSFSSRIANAMVGYVAYLGKFLCPVGLAVFYPHPEGNLPVWQPLGALVILVGISAAALASRRRCPYLLVGWLWYVGMLVPVIGLVQVGKQAMADRYTYLPQIGLCVALAWAGAEVCRSWSRRWLVCGVTSIVALAVMMAWRQTTFWQDSKTLWTHALACTSQNYVAHNDLGLEMHHRGRLDKAMAHYQQALEIKPDYAEAHFNLGNALAGRGQVASAIIHYQKALEIKPDYAEAHNNLAVALAGRGQGDSAIAHWQKALDVKPDYADAHNNLAGVLTNRGQIDSAIIHYQQALEINPDYADAHGNLGRALIENGRFDEAIAQLQRALQIKPDHAEAHNNLAWLRATCPAAAWRNSTEAIAHAERAKQLLGDMPGVLDTLAAAYAEAGRFSEAVGTARKGLEFANRQNHHALANDLATRIALYEARKPYHQPLSASTPAKP
jgi:tetratricopeptide (TPR) repeat protein